MRVLVGRVAKKHGVPRDGSIDDGIDLLHALTSFETFDALAAETRTPEQVTTLLIRAAHRIVGLAGSA